MDVGGSNLLYFPLLVKQVDFARVTLLQMMILPRPSLIIASEGGFSPVSLDFRSSMGEPSSALCDTSEAAIITTPVFSGAGRLHIPRW